jgi:glycosyltransferase involved in cell wall biosynthesis
MKILMFGVQPYGSAGIVNYVRPLAARYKEMGHEVYCFHSGTWELRYDWYYKPYLKFNAHDFPYEYAELINAPCWRENFGRPDLDEQEDQTEQVFLQYIDRIKPDVMHVNGFTGLPVSLVRVAAGRGIPVIVTHHVYWPLCQKQVMIDYNGSLCEGPVDFDKCSRCTGRLNLKREMLAARLRNTNGQLVEMLAKIRRRFAAKATCGAGAAAENTPADGALAEALRHRLGTMVSIMNDHVAANVCVSTDVKNTLMRFGVKEDKLVVCHIGSSIAEKQLASNPQLHSPFVIGNIGGVAHYKGTHVLVEAATKVRNRNFIVKIFGKYDQKYVDELRSRFDTAQVEFTGRYVPEDLPEILKQIDVMVLPSICNDTAPQTIFESFSGGVPIIASNIGGFPDFVEHGQNGLLFEPGNSDDLARSIEYVLDAPERLSLYRHNIPKLKTIKENADEMISVYQSARR